MKIAVLNRLLKAARERESAVLITRLDDGAQRLLLGDESFGDPPPPSVESQAKELMNADSPREISQDGARYFIEPHRPPRRLIIVGAVHIAQSLAEFGRRLGFECFVIDPRAAWATPSRFPRTSLLRSWPDDALADIQLDSGDALVALTHDPKIDDPALIAALSRPTKYIGALGSRRTHAQRLARLREEGGGGVSEDSLSRIHAPVGLDIGARSAAEIALAIAAEIVAEFRGGGLLAKIDERPSPRIPKAARRRPVIAAVLLAAGESKRMGKENKLLADWRGKPLARYAAETLTKAKENGIIDEIIAVTGRDNQLIEDALAELPLTFTRNFNYESGMASSIKRGLKSVGDKADAALFVLADMPLVSAQTISALADAINLGGGGRDIAIPICNGKRGNPVLVGRNYFSELAQISGDIGARALFSRFANSIIEVEVSDGGVLFDLDSPSDWQ